MASRIKKMGPLVLVRYDGTLTEWGMAALVVGDTWRGTSYFDAMWAVILHVHATPQQ